MVVVVVEVVVVVVEVVMVMYGDSAGIVFVPVAQVDVTGM